MSTSAIQTTHIQHPSSQDAHKSSSSEESKLDKIKKIALITLKAVGILVGCTLVGALIGGGIGGVLGIFAGMGYVITSGAAYVSGAFTGHIIAFAILGGLAGTTIGLGGGIAVISGAEPSDRTIEIHPGEAINAAFMGGALSGAMARMQHRRHRC